MSREPTDSGVVSVAQFEALVERVSNMSDRLYRLERRVSNILLGKECAIVFRDLGQGDWFRKVEVRVPTEWDTPDAIWRKLPEGKAMSREGWIWGVDHDEPVIPVQVSIKETEAK